MNIIKEERTFSIGCRVKTTGLPDVWEGTITKLVKCGTRCTSCNTGGRAMQLKDVTLNGTHHATVMNDICTLATDSYWHWELA